MDHENVFKRWQNFEFQPFLSNEKQKKKRAHVPFSCVCGLIGLKELIGVLY